MNIDYQQAIDKIAKKVKKISNTGQIASYIPELRKVNSSSFGVHLSTNKGDEFGFGDYQNTFSVQSIAKVLSLTLAYDRLDSKLWDRVGVEPSGTSFNSLVQLETENGKPRNPLINAGAIVVCDVLLSISQNAENELLAFARDLSGNQQLVYNFSIANSEAETSFRNRALINLMKDFGNINNEIEDVLHLYFKLCSIEMSCADLSRTFLFLANEGINPKTGKRIISKSKSKRINAIMQLCGFYDEAGEFAFKVGLPGKSGVGGGIAAVLPGEFSIAVWSPKLNVKGNSYLGMHFLENFTTEIGFSIY